MFLLIHVYKLYYLTCFPSRLIYDLWSPGYCTVYNTAPATGLNLVQQWPQQELGWTSYHNISLFQIHYCLDTMVTKAYHFVYKSVCDQCGKKFGSEKKIRASTETKVHKLLYLLYLSNYNHPSSIDGPPLVLIQLAQLTLQLYC